MIPKPTNSMSANYDPIAKYYDGLSRMVFGDSIKRSQQYLLKYIQPKSNILIVGGGTGWILEEISKLHNQDLNITYVEQSAKMMEMSKKRDAGLNKVNFKCQPIQSVRLQGCFDIVIVPFLFDNFSPFTINRILEKINLYLTPDSLWLFADFTSKNRKLWSAILLKMMYGILGPLCNLETFSLPDSAASFKKNDYHVTHEALFFGGFIRANIYRKGNKKALLLHHPTEIICPESNNSTLIA